MAAFSALRIVLGLAAVAKYRRRSTRVKDSELIDVVEELRAKFGYASAIEARESSEISSPATIGWRRPVILLPIEWRGWTAEERRVVISHEVAHIARGDYGAWVLAQFGVALHFYHPLVHWLSARLRVEQELAADGLAASAAGGRSHYLETLARMALRADDPAPLAWAARPFFPGSGAFLRRINMLRQEKELNTKSLSTFARGAVAFGVVALGLLVAGIRGPEQLRSAHAVEEPGAKKQQADSKENATNLAANEADEEIEEKLKVIVGALHRYHKAHGYFPPRVIRNAEGKPVLSWRVAILPYMEQAPLYDAFNLNEPWDSKYNRPYSNTIVRTFMMPDAMTPDGAVRANTQIVIPEGPGAILSGEKPTTSFKDVTDGTAYTILLAVADKDHEVNWASPEDLPYDPEEPTQGLRVTSNGGIQVGVASGDVYTLKKEIRPALLNALFTKSGGDLIDQDELEKSIMQPEADSEALVRRRQSMRNVMTIMLAMHNFADANRSKHKGHSLFPASSMLGPDGKTPHSWRVALLPYLDQKALYDQYKLDEPWDSENNLKVLAKMPEVYQSPMVKENPKFHASYFVFTGVHAPFKPAPRLFGPRFREISDGLSNTIAVIESRQEIPWTKPDDIPYEPDAQPAFNGYYGENFVTGFFDGHARFISEKADPDTLGQVIQPADGKSIDYDKL